MINAFTNLLARSLFNPRSQQLNTKIIHQFGTVNLYHRLDIDALSDKWHVDFTYQSAQLTLNEQYKVRPFNFGKPFVIKFVQKSQRFVKGRPEYRIDFSSNQIIQLSNWEHKMGKFQIVRTNQFKEEVFTLEQVIKKQPDQITKEFSTPIKVQGFPLKLYRFKFYNNKLDNEKSKEFYLNTADFLLFQQTLKSSFDALTFNENKEEYEISKLERQIVKKEIIINKEQTQ